MRSLQAGVPDGDALLAARHRASLSPSLFSLLFSPTDARLLARAQYSINSNGSLSMNPLPFATDGRIQTENPCTPQTAVLAEYAEFEMWDTWEIKIDSHHEAYSLQAVRADIGKLPRCAPSPLLCRERVSRRTRTDSARPVRPQALPHGPPADHAPDYEPDGRLVRRRSLPSLLVRCSSVERSCAELCPSVPAVLTLFSLGARSNGSVPLL